jgi:hypothetical protein
MTAVKRDLAAVKRNRIRQGFLDVLVEYKIKPEEAKRLFADALNKQFEEVETEITPEAILEVDGVPCNKCGKLVICRYGIPLCMRCKYQKVLKFCVDCKCRIDPSSTRCFDCNRKQMVGARKFGAKRQHGTRKTD